MMLLQFICCILAAGSLGEATSQNRLLWRTIRALDQALDYLDGQIENINLDGAIGPRMADDQISLLLNRTTLFQKRSYQKFLPPLSLLQRKAESLADRAIPIVKQSDPQYYKDIGNILSDGIWLLNYPERETTSNRRRTSNISFVEQFDEYMSDKCLSEVIGSEDDIYCQCRISEQCWGFMTAPMYNGYALTHEVIFLQLIDMCNCQRKVEPYQVRYNQTNLTTMYDYFCSKILNEAIAIVDYKKTTKQDLFMEQIAICGMIGFVDFYRPEWLKAILSWQLPNGCYSLKDDPIWPKSTPGSKNREKREERILEDGCHSHTTSVAVITLAVNIRLMLTQEHPVI